MHSVATCGRRRRAHILGTRARVVVVGLWSRERGGACQAGTLHNVTAVSESALWRLWHFRTAHDGSEISTRDSRSREVGVCAILLEQHKRHPIIFAAVILKHVQGRRPQVWLVVLHDDSIGVGREVASVEWCGWPVFRTGLVAAEGIILFQDMLVIHCKGIRGIGVQVFQLDVNECALSSVAEINVPPGRLDGISVLFDFDPYYSQACAVSRCAASRHHR